MTTGNTVHYSPREKGKRGTGTKGRPTRGKESPKRTRPPSAEPNENGTGRESRRSASSDSVRTAQRRRTTASSAGRRTQKRPRPPTPEEKARRREAIRRKQKARARRRQILAWMVLIAVIVGGVFLSITFLFRVSSVEVQDGEGQPVENIGSYTAGQLTNALGLTEKNTIFDFRIRKTEERLEKEFPLLEDVRLTRRYPGTVILQAQEARPKWLVQTEEGWLSVSSSLKILSVLSSSEGQEGIVLCGGEPVSCVAGDTLLYGKEEEEAGSTPTADERMEAFDALTKALEEREMLSDITRIEVENAEEIAFLYKNRVSVLLGTIHELDCKLDEAKYLLEGKDGNGFSETDTGNLDCEYIRGDKSPMTIVKPGVPVMPSGYRVEQSGTELSPEGELSEEKLSEGESSEEETAEETDGEEAYVLVNGKKIPISELVE